jgi:hypothetical protein
MGARREARHHEDQVLFELLVQAEARQLRDEHLREIEDVPFAELVTRFNRRTRRELVDRHDRTFEVLSTGGFDTDESSDFFVWLYVRPASVASVPVLRWLLSARAVHLRDNPNYPADI